MSRIAGILQGRGATEPLAVPIAAFFLILAGGAYGLAALWPMLDEVWSNIYGAFSHGYLVLILCIWLAVRACREGPPRRLAPVWSAAWLLIALVLALIGMDVLFLNTPRLALLPLLFLASIALTFGWSAARALFLPSVFLYFALPQWWAINGMLQALASAVVGAVVEGTGMPAFVEGNFIHVPAGMFEIASGCSGLNYLVAALSLAGFYALMYLKRWKSRLLLLAAAAGAAILSNFVRIYALIAIGIATDMQHYLIRVDHLYFGWVLFMVSLLPVLWFARKLDDADNAAMPEPQTQTTSHGSIFVAKSVLPAALVTGLILALPEVVTIETEGSTVEAPALPERVGAWVRSDASGSPWRPSFVNAQEELARYADASGTGVDVYRATYAHQTRDARVIRTENDFFGAGWRLAEQGVVEVDAPPVAKTLESRGYLNDRERLIWSWYVLADAAAATKLGAKVQELRGFAQRRRDASALAVSTECVPDCAAARERLAAFMQGSAASLQ